MLHDPYGDLSLDNPLFVETGDYQEIADLDWGGGYHYAAGYRNAGLLVADNAETTTYDSDMLVYPVWFLFRHAVELQLKGIIGYQQEAPVGHDLVRLWKVCRPIIELWAVGYGGATLDAVEVRLSELQGRDNESATAARYAFDRTGERSVRGRINLRTFAERAERLCAVLDGWDTAVYEGVYGYHSEDE